MGELCKFDEGRLIKNTHGPRHFVAREVHRASHGAEHRLV